MIWCTVWSDNTENVVFCRVVLFFFHSSYNGSFGILVILVNHFSLKEDKRIWVRQAQDITSTIHIQCFCIQWRLLSWSCSIFIRLKCGLWLCSYQLNPPFWLSRSLYPERPRLQTPLHTERLKRSQYDIFILNKPHGSLSCRGHIELVSHTTSFVTRLKT